VGNDVGVRVAYDCHSLLTSPTGIARYTRRLGDALEAGGVELARFAIGWSGSAPDGVAHRRLPNPVVHRTWRALGVPSIRPLTGDVDLVHGTEFVLPPLRGVPGVVTIHDVSYLREDAFPGAKRLRSMVPWTLRRAARVLVPSATVAGELKEAYGDAAGAVVVTHEGIGEEFFAATPLDAARLAALGITGPFALVVGELQPRKNLPALLEAWSRARERLPGWSLVVAGPAGWGPALPETDGAVPVGWVPDELLPGLMAAAELFCFPSHYEGFGLPPLEAMAAGTAVLAGNYDSALEMLGDAAHLVDQRDVGALAEAIVTLAQDPERRAELSRRGRERARSFTWQSTAAATVRVYEEVLAGR
jgi:glycosyltransferase involved in cell wall biosynthesis